VFPFDFMALASEIISERIPVPETRIAAIITNVIVFIIETFNFMLI
jgi:hypothetical protein